MHSPNFFGFGVWTYLLLEGLVLAAPKNEPYFAGSQLAGSASNTPADKRSVGSSALRKRTTQGYLDINSTSCTNTTANSDFESDASIAVDILKSARDFNTSNPVWRYFIAEAIRDEQIYLSGFLEKAALVEAKLNDTDPKYVVPVICNDNGPTCTYVLPNTTDVYHPYAYAQYNLSTTFEEDPGYLNLCKPFRELPPAKGMECEDGKAMSKYVNQAFAIIHESFHIAVQQVTEKNPTIYVQDVVYDFDDSHSLANFRCPDQVRAAKLCVPRSSTVNVDSLTWMVFGNYWLKKCKDKGLSIPIE